MNRLEELSKENSQNYEEYLMLMTESMKSSTKGEIPRLASEGCNILDIGCGSGVMLKAISRENPSAKLTGLDLNIEAINKLKKEKSNFRLYYMDFMALKDIKFDTIIFSSILHEISSYHRNKAKRFTEVPVIEALIKSNQLLEKDGHIIIRDGLLSPVIERDQKRIISFMDVNDCTWLYRFQRDFRGFDCLPIDTSIIRLDDNKFLVSEGFLKEFLYTYTWGPESYHREISERFGILTKDEWLNIIRKTGFKTEVVVEAKEGYQSHLLHKVKITNVDGSPYEYPNMSIMMKAQKVRTLKNR